MTIPAHQNFAFDFKVALSDKAPIRIHAEMKWNGRAWDMQINPATKKKLSQEVIDEIEVAAEKYGETLIQEAGYELPIPIPTKIEINVKPESLSPEAQLQLIAAPTQLKTGGPTNHIVFEEGVLLQLWAGTIETWEKGQKPTVTHWEEWYKVAGQPCTPK